MAGDGRSSRVWKQMVAVTGEGRRGFSLYATLGHEILTRIDLEGQCGKGLDTLVWIFLLGAHLVFAKSLLLYGLRNSWQFGEVLNHWQNLFFHLILPCLSPNSAEKSVCVLLNTPSAVRPILALSAMCIWPH
jgi:hypothetical protein